MRYASCPGPVLGLSLALYVSDSPTLSLANARRLSQGGGGGLPPATTHHLDRAFSRVQLQQAGVDVTAGTTAYAVAHGAGLWGMLYTDPATGQRQDWPSLNLVPSPVVRFTMP